MPLPTPGKTPAPGRGRRAFTLIELLTVIAIIAVLASIVLTSVGRVRSAARSIKCTSNLKQIGSAFWLYAAENRGLFPAARYSATVNSPNKNPGHDNWQREISRYLTRDSSLADIKKAGADVNVAHCPAYDLLFPDLAALVATPYKAVGYGMNVNLPGIPVNSAYDTRFLATSLKYPASTVLVGDSTNYHIDIKSPTWGAPVTDTVEGYYSGAPKRHGNTANYLFCDGHVAKLTPDQALAVLPPRP